MKVFQSTGRESGAKQEETGGYGNGSLFRGGKKMDISVKLGERPGN